jgi:PPOX class probable F420-dependent enzyme
MNRRALIRMTADEALAFLEEQRTVIVATNGRDGRPHLMPLWYVLRDGRLWGWTYAKSQKARNLERDPRATLQVEAGTEYHELRGLMLRTDVVLHREPGVIEGIAMELVDRYGGGDPAREVFRTQVPKRVGLEFVERGRVSWDHGKLGATY